MTETREIAPYERARLPWPPGAGVTPAEWKTLVDAIFPAAKTPEAILLALNYCKARNLDPFKRQVHIVPVWSSEQKRMVETVWPGISELRTTAIRTGRYAGCEATEWGPILDEALDGVRVRYPEWARITLHRTDARGRRETFVGPQVFWLETYATRDRNSAAPNAMWAKRPRGQLEKAAEAAALRRAFPEELGGEYAAEEMEGRIVGSVPAGQGAALAALPAPVALHAGFSAEAVLEAPEATGGPIVIETASGGDGDDNEPPQVAANDDEPFDVLAWGADFNRNLDGYADVDVMRADWLAHKDALKAAAPSLFKLVNAAVAKRAEEIGKAAA